MNRFLRVVTVVSTWALLGLISPLSSAQEFVPAHFNVEDEARLITNEIEFPRRGMEGAVVALCGAEITTPEGRIRRHRCYSTTTSTSDFNAYDRAIDRAVSGSRAVPARVNGNDEVVWFNFAVVFQKQGEEESITVLPNHLYELQERGAAYTSAQRIIRAPWRSNDCMRANTRYAVQVAAEIDTQGRPSNARKISGTVIGACESELLELLRTHAYIPAMDAEGQPFESTYVELFVGG